MLAEEGGMCRLVTCVLTSKDPFDLLDELIPPKMPTRKVTEKEWKELTKGIHVDLD